MNKASEGTIVDLSQVIRYSSNDYNQGIWAKKIDGKFNLEGEADYTILRTDNEDIYISGGFSYFSNGAYIADFLCIQCNYSGSNEWDDNALRHIIHNVNEKGKDNDRYIDDLEIADLLYLINN